MLAQRQRQRLTEAASTQDKKLAWAKQQVAKSSTAGLFDNILPNTGLDQVSNRGSAGNVCEGRSCKRGCAVAR